MHKSIWVTLAGAALLLAVACGASNQPTTSEQQQGPTASVEKQDRQNQSGQSQTEPTAVPASVISAPRTPAVQSQVGPTATPRTSSSSQEARQDTKSSSQSALSSFIQGVGREYPGLLTLPECDASSLLTIPPLDDDAYKVIIPLGLLSSQHVPPTSHVYYYLVRESTPSNSYGTPAVAPMARRSSTR